MTEKHDLRIVFMGTPDFAVATLRALIEHNYNVVGVITAPDRPAGRGQKLRASAVKAFAMQILCNICEKEPELANELMMIIEDQIPHSSIGFKNRGTKILKLLRNL